MQNTSKLLKVINNLKNNKYSLKFLNTRLNSNSRNYLKTWLGNVGEKLANDLPAGNSIKINQHTQHLFLSKYSLDVSTINFNLMSTEKLSEYLISDNLSSDFFLLDMKNVAGSINDYDQLKNAVKAIQVFLFVVLNFAFFYIIYLICSL
jgi:hypothetical protein